MLMELGCCGAYCRTCRVFGSPCRGCKTGYKSGNRDLSKARCKIKVCCMGKGFGSCADCTDFDMCPVLEDFYAKKGYKYGKYMETLVFIRKEGYAAFEIAAKAWKNAYGKL